MIIIEEENVIRGENSVVSFKSIFHGLKSYGRPYGAIVFVIFYQYSTKTVDVYYEYTPRLLDNEIIGTVCVCFLPFKVY